MPKIIKPENVLSEEDKNSITTGVSTISQVSKDKNIPYQSVYNQVKKGKLGVVFEKGSKDNDKGVNASLPDFKEPEKIVDYTIPVNNFWSFVDMVFRFICPLFKMDYDAMDNVAISDLTNKTKDKLGKLITGHQYVDWLGTVGAIGYAFVSRVRAKPKEGKKESVKFKEIIMPSKQEINKALEDSSGYTELIKGTELDKNDSDYKLTDDGLVKSDLNPEEIKKLLGI